CAWPRDRRVSICALTYVFLVGFSRLYSGVHYPTDILAGWMLGAFFAALVIWLADRKQIRADSESVE
ncbi:MAG: phosphatase PAP2 family protein, partial [Fimbriimonadaceae bacterium]|nr:phosphatase PAP2 family protein [Fimbriimonadaceae bacterium]